MKNDNHPLRGACHNDNHPLRGGCHVCQSDIHPLQGGCHDILYILNLQGGYPPARRLSKCIECHDNHLAGDDCHYDKHLAGGGCHPLDNHPPGGQCHSPIRLCLKGFLLVSYGSVVCSKIFPGSVPQGTLRNPEEPLRNCL